MTHGIPRPECAYCSEPGEHKFFIWGEVVHACETHVPNAEYEEDLYLNKLKKEKQWDEDEI